MDRRNAGLPLEPSVDEHMQLSAFEGKFNITDFVGSISERLISQSKAESGPFDPKPFIRSFEAAVDKLIAVRKDVQARTEQMEKSVRVAEREYSRKMAELNRGFESVGQSFSGMEKRMDEVGSTAVRIGEQLDTVHIERQRAQAAFDLISYYNQFVKEDTSKLDGLKKESRDGRRQVAIILRRLNTVAKEIDLPTAEATRERIEKYCEKFEKDMLYLFDRSYRKGDPKMMHHCAQTLLDFNGGSSCVQVYVNQHDFFINRVREVEPTDDVNLWTALPDPNATPPKTEAGLEKLFTEIRQTVDEEAKIVKAVFPHPPVVMQVFLQRVFAQSIQQHMEQILDRGTSISDLAYLRLLQMVHSQASLLVDDLKAYELPASGLGSRSSMDAATLTGSTTSGPTTAMSTILETALEELFVPYTEGQRYLERESRSLGALYAGLLVNFTRYHERTEKTKASMFDRMVNQLSKAAETSSTGGGSTTAAAFLRIGGIGIGSSERAVDKGDQEPLREEDGLLSIATAELMLKWHAEAIGRAVELSASNDIAKNTFSLLRVLAEAICNAYVEAALETAQARVDAADSKSEPNLQPLSVLNSVDLICQLWQQYVNTAIMPLASSSVTIRREIAVFNNQTVSRLEGRANHLLQKVTDIVVAWLAAQLAKQKRNDFKPRNDDLSFARVNTEPCELCCETLEKVGNVAKRSLSGKNLEVFLTEVGIAFHSLLLDHLRKFPVSATGGLMLAKDLKSYQDVVSAFGIPSLHERFEFIRQLGNVFLVRPEILRSYITENYLGRIDASLLRPYLAQRSDWGQFEKGFDDGSDLNGDPGSPDVVSGNPVVGGAEEKGLRDRLGVGRLTVMMKELEGLKLGEGLSSIGMPSISGFSVPSNFSVPSMPGSLTSGFSLSTRIYG